MKVTRFSPKVKTTLISILAKDEKLAGLVQSISCALVTDVTFGFAFLLLKKLSMYKG